MLNRKFNSNLTIALKESYFKNLKYLNRLTFLTRITKIMTAQFTMATAFTLLGGLAIFLFGMNMMSDNIQKVAGEKMRAILGMLTKNPVVVSKNRGHRELVRHEETSYLVNVNDVQAMYEYVKKLLLDEEHRASMGEQAAMFAQEFNFTYVKEELKKVYGL